MSSQSLSALRRALIASPDPHLDDAATAELVSAEIAGEPVEQIYPEILGHIEVCVPCAEAYGELFELSLAAVTGMAEAAAAIDPLDVYAEILVRETLKRTGSHPELPNIVRRVAAQLPTLFSDAPASASDIHLEAIAARLGEAAAQPEASQAITAITESIRQNLSTLSLYLSRTAEMIWGRPLKTAVEMVAGLQSWQFRPASQAAVPILGDAATSMKWPLADRYIGEPIPLRVTAQAERIAPLACRIQVRLDRPGLSSPAGRPVQLLLAGEVRTNQTDLSGAAYFEPVPIAAVPEIEIRFPT